MHPIAANAVGSIDAVIKELEAKRVRAIKAKQGTSEKLLEQNAYILLHKLLARSCNLLRSGLSAIQSKQLLTLALSARAQMETTALLGYKLKNFRRFDKQEISRLEMEEHLRRLYLGNKEDCSGVNVIPINVLTAMDALDIITKEIFGDQKTFRKNYEFLSELCHPNLQGTSALTVIEETKREIRFLNDEEAFAQADSIILLLDLAGGFFYRFFNELDTLLHKNNALPESTPWNI